MDQKIQVLVIGRHPEIMQTVTELINKTEDWEATGALSDETAIEYYQKRRFDVVLIGGGVEHESEAKLRAIFTFQNPLIRIVQHYGGGSGLLFAEIKNALLKQPKAKTPWLKILILIRPYERNNQKIHQRRSFRSLET